jgi:hypothetical protein
VASLFAVSLFAACGGRAGDEPPLLGGCSDSTCVDGGGADGASGNGGSAALSPNGGVHEVTGALDGGVCPGTATVDSPGAAVTPDVASCCASGFELNDATDGSTYTVASLDADGAGATTLAVDLATYQEPDRVGVRATVDGRAIALFDSCELQTGSISDPTGGKGRPPDSLLRSFTVQVPAGTTALTFDFTGVQSPMYLRTLGLCSFDVGKAPAYRFGAVELDADGGTCAAADGGSVR